MTQILSRYQKIETISRITRNLEIALENIDCPSSYLEHIERANELLDGAIESEHAENIEVLDAKQAWDSEKLFDEIHDPYEEVIG